MISGWPNFALSAAMISRTASRARTAAEREPATAAITGLRMREMRPSSARKSLHEGVRVRHAGHRLDVGAGRERLLVPVMITQAMSEDRSRTHRSRAVISSLTFGVERVERGRPVEADDADLAFGFDDDGFVGHDASAPE